MIKYTPGPWFVVEYGGFFEIQDKDDYQGTIITDLEKCPDAEANARLMASAPDLLTSLKEITKEYELVLKKYNTLISPHENMDYQTISEAHEVIKKATE
jgi:hypothetical protein